MQPTPMKRGCIAVEKLLKATASAVLGDGSLFAADKEFNRVHVWKRVEDFRVRPEEDVLRW